MEILVRFVERDRIVNRVWFRVFKYCNIFYYVEFFEEIGSVDEEVLKIFFLY